MSGIENPTSFLVKTPSSDSRKHLVTYSRVRPHECLVCHKGFVRADSLNNHLCVQSEVKPREIIKIDFTQEDTELKRYFPKSKEEPTSVCTPESCKICGREYPYPSHLKRHLQKHTKERPFICEICEQCYSVKQSLLDHLRLHTGERPYHCAICNRSYMWKASLYNHNQRHHRGERPFSCKLCNKRFPSKYLLSAHLVFHGRQIIYSCPECKRKFHWKPNYITHLKVHSRMRTRPAVEIGLEKDQLKCTSSSSTSVQVKNIK